MQDSSQINREGRFLAAFARWSARVRSRMATNLVLTGLAVGLVVGAATAAVLWKTRHGSLRPWSAVAGAFGAVGGYVVASRRRWRDEQIALYLDGRLGSGEVVTTALHLKGTGQDTSDDGYAVVLNQAADALENGDPKRVRPAIFQPWHLLVPVAAAAIVYMSWVPLPAPVVTAKPPGSDIVTLAEVKGLEKVEDLKKIEPRDEEQKKRLEKIADDAKKLREKLREGMERREALSEISKLQDAIEAERMSFGDAERRQGLEAALERLAREKLTADAAKALGDRDLVKFDEEMQKLANSAEAEDREKAKKVLEEAAEAAKKNGASDVAKELEKQKELLDKRGKRADALRELGEALKGGLSEEQKKDLEEFGHNGGNDKDAKKYAKELNDALEKLSPEERKKLAEKLKKKMEGDAQMSPSSKDQMRDLIKKLESEEGKKALEDELRKLANEDDEDDEAKRQKGLDDGKKGADQAQKGLGAPVPVPMDGDSPGQPGGDKGDKGDKGNPGNGDKGNNGGEGKDGTPGPGSKHDKGTGDHKGNTPEIKGNELRSRAKSKINSGAPNAGLSIGRTNGKAGDTANLRGSGAIGDVGPSEVNGVERSEVPEEYREQVGRYFTP